ncbi:YihY/virulence factor BrkB family protein [Alkalimarinus alittae]|uniref:YihY/virulence factor BrkB family protein n=1 Tax=Alkalimarinus alittae TaxID=2961619 RepID=A0ABY6N023_9ALTE|nr:YihY/virulence factor BrkB family protein [Alkalimarinus alittae]UZE95441.1 YihY/virulence factor BrkB family protein [Alkalimarinus alittae]
MNLSVKIEQLEAWLFSNQKGLGKARQSVRRVARVLFAVIRDVLSGNLTLHAMGLVYTTMLSVVPLLALSFSVLKAMGVHNQLTPLLYSFFEPMGKQGIDIANNVLGFVDNIKVGVLGSVGLVLLIYTVISLVQKIERSFNYIWRVPQLRSISQRFSNYLSVIMVGPLLMASAIGVTATIMKSPIIHEAMQIEVFGFLIASLSKLTPFLFIIAAFTFVYLFMPNTKVRFRSALVGGIVSGVTWQMTGVLFASFVMSSAQYEAIYSGFAVGIVLLIWLYICWLILLLGSSIAYYDQNFSGITRSYDVKVSAEVSERLALTIMEEVARRYDRSEAPITQLQLEELLPVPPVLTRDVSDKLLRQSILMVAGESGDAIVPATSLDKISVLDVIKAVRVDEEKLMERLRRNTSLTVFHESIDQVLEHQFKDMSLQQLVRQPL